jgi:hypothetical protein
MSDQDLDYEDDAQDTQAHRNPVRARMRELENEVKTAREQLAVAQSAQRELAFVKAGVDLSAPVTKYFVKGYDGELTPEAIRAAAEEANLIPKTETPTENKPETEAWNRLQQLSKRAERTEPPVDWTSRINQAKSPEEVQALLAQARQEAENI